VKTFSDASEDVLISLEQMLKAHHDELRKVKICSLFIYDDEEPNQVLMHQGYRAAAMVRICSLRERASGTADAVMVIDRACWLEMDKPQRDALVDHELMHLELVEDEQTGKTKYDSIGRPKLRLRKHDHQFGWFDAVALRHKEASIEVRQARELIASTGQLYFDFGGAPPKGAVEVVGTPAKKPTEEEAAAVVTSALGRAIQGHSRKKAREEGQPPLNG
jgi:hypothetical protein